jgi:hypothetical protein
MPRRRSETLPASDAARSQPNQTGNPALTMVVRKGAYFGYSFGALSPLFRPRQEMVGPYTF